MSTFADRHIGPSGHEQDKMLAECGYPSLGALIEAAVPAAIRDLRPLNLPPAASEVEATAELRALAAMNRPMTQMIGLGFHDTVTPPVIRRNVLESPAWYTAYTPYQPEISQGRLEALLNFQTMVSGLTGLDTANASLLDESTAVVEAILLMRRMSKARSQRVVLDAECLPQTIAVVRTRAEAVGIEVDVRDLEAGLPAEFFGVVVQYPGSSGLVRGKDFYQKIGAAAREAGALYTVAADLLALTLVTPPGEFGADVAAGTTQRFGVPLGYGGPHAGYLAVRSGLERSLPGRLVGVSVDADGNPAYRLALQTREQHIRREKATSNICTAQVLPAVLAAMYAVYHGPDGLKRIAGRVHSLATGLAASLRQGGVEVVHERFFDTVLARVPGRAGPVVDAARRSGINLGWVDADHVRVACDEVTTVDIVNRVLDAFGVRPAEGPGSPALPASLARTGDYLTHEVFHSHRSETAMLRYLRRLSDQDYALDRGMIPLGSCTMKLNATAEMEPISWPEFAGLHPFAPAEDAAGYHELIAQLSGWLAEVTGYDQVSLQPNAGSQGELAGLLAIRAYHRANGQPERTVCLIPSSAHGTNAASAVLAGMRVVVVACDGDGDVDPADLESKVAEHRETLAAIMVTYPSTHGVYETGIADIARIVHEAGGQVYVDGANLNALLGLAKPGEFGGDVSHLNLHKTFCIPHGGGGPGVGPVAVRAHLAPYLPAHPQSPDFTEGAVGPIASAPFGSASILPISWAYIRMMGGPGLTRATKVAVLAANYVAARLSPHYPVLYTGRRGLVAHECILDLRGLTKRTGVTVEDVAKRLVDYGFHAPTMSFPVAGTLMVEPTESEDVAEIDRFCDAMIAIRREIEEVAEGRWPLERSPLRNAPHTAVMLTGDWDLPYDRRKAVYPMNRFAARSASGEGGTGRWAGASPAAKYWPPVRRIEGAYGDRNLVCSCPAITEYSADTSRSGS